MGKSLHDSYSADIVEREMKRKVANKKSRMSLGGGTDSGIVQSKVELKLRVDIRTQSCLVFPKVTFKVRGFCSNYHHSLNPNMKAGGRQWCAEFDSKPTFGRPFKGAGYSRGPALYEYPTRLLRRMLQSLRHNATPQDNKTVMSRPSFFLIKKWIKSRGFCVVLQ